MSDTATVERPVQPGAPAIRSSKPPIKPGDVGVLVLAAVVLLLLVAPFLWIITTSLMSSDRLLSPGIRILPEDPSLANYRTLFDSEFATYIVNSIKVTIPSIFFAVVLALPAAYVFSRRKFRFRGVLLLLVVMTQIFPFIVLITPLYTLFLQIGLVNSHAGLIVAYTAISLPLCIYMLLGFIDSIPRELDEAAAIDGAGTLRTLFRVILPTAWPGIGAVSIFAFTVAWNEFLLALTLLTDRGLRTIPVGLAGLFGEFGADWGQVMAASVIATLPTLVVFFLLQKQLVSNITAGAVK